MLVCECPYVFVVCVVCVCVLVCVCVRVCVCVCGRFVGVYGRISVCVRTWCAVLRRRGIVGRGCR